MTTQHADATVADVVAVLDRHYPPETAEDWDAVGLAVGSRSARVSRILYTVDVTLVVVQEAVSVGADLIVAHHPLLLRGVHAVDLDHPKGRIVGELLRHGISVYVAHTNADVPPGGVVDTLARCLGLLDCRPLRPRPTPPLDKIVSFVPHDHVEAVIDALAAAGAGALGHYERAAFTSPGTGTFRPTSGANPYLGRVGEVEEVPETRLEMVLPRSSRDAVVRALKQAHPYEEVAYDVWPLSSTTDPLSGLGRIGRLQDAMTLGAFVEHAARVLPASGGGLRVSGEWERPVRAVAVQAGAGDDLLDAARQAGADVYLTSDLRHHPASEARAWPDAPALVDVPHWAAESLWLPVALHLVSDGLAEGGHDVPASVSRISTDPWNHAR